jgi:hypothetical protein
VVPGDTNSETRPPIWDKFEETIKREEPSFSGLTEVERHEFYERSRSAYAIVATTETAIYANIILKKVCTASNVVSSASLYCCWLTNQHTHTHTHTHSLSLSLSYPNQPCIPNRVSVSLIRVWCIRRMLSSMAKVTRYCCEDANNSRRHVLAQCIPWYSAPCVCCTINTCCTRYTGAMTQ